MVFSSSTLLAIVSAVVGAGPGTSFGDNDATLVLQKDTGTYTISESAIAPADGADYDQSQSCVNNVTGTPVTISANQNGDTGKFLRVMGDIHTGQDQPEPHKAAPITLETVQRLSVEEMDEAIRLVDQLANAQRALNAAATALATFWENHP